MQKLTKDLILQQLVEEYLRKMDDPIYAEAHLKCIIGRCFSNVVKEKYNIVVFDSPEGSASKATLESKGYFAEWMGHQGCRGETRVYVKKEENIGDFIFNLKMWELTDKNSVITITNE